MIKTTTFSQAAAFFIKVKPIIDVSLSNVISNIIYLEPTEYGLNLATGVTKIMLLGKHLMV